MRTATTTLIAPAASTGLLMATYLLARPYGDAAGAETLAAAHAFASPWWIASHVFGLLALASYAWLAVRVSNLATGAIAAIARWSGLMGAVLALPYYGAETFGLHAVGARALAGDPAALELVDPIRNQPVAITMFGLGLLSLAASGITTALAWQRSGLGNPAWAAWPLGLGIALVLPQFFLPPAGRIAFGIAYAIAAAVLVMALIRRSARAEAHAAHPLEPTVEQSTLRPEFNSFRRI